MSERSKAAVKRFFDAFGRGDLEALVQCFDPAATITAVRAAGRKAAQVHGSYVGQTGAREFVTNLGNAFETQAFAVDQLVAEGDVVFAKGSFTHRVKTTRKAFSSDWALMCRISDNRIAEYQFFEDSAALVAADPATAYQA